MKDPVDLIGSLGVAPVIAIESVEDAAEATMPEWLSMPQVLALGDAWIANTEDIREGRFSEITRKAANAVGIARELLEQRA